MGEVTSSPTTRLEISLFGFVRDLAAQTRIALDVPRGSSLRDVLECLLHAQGDRLRQRLLTSGGVLQPGVQVFAAGQSLSSLDDRLPESPSLPVKILVLHSAAGG